MDERVRAAGGTLVAGPVDGAWVVRVEVPLPSPTAVTIAGSPGVAAGGSAAPAGDRVPTGSATA
jgi:hypothetical protein